MVGRVGYSGFILSWLVRWGGVFDLEVGDVELAHGVEGGPEVEGAIVAEGQDEVPGGGALGSGGVDFQPLAGDVDLGPGVGGEKGGTVGGRLIVDEANDEFGGNAGCLAQGGGEDRVFGAVALFAFEDFDGAGVADGEVFLADILSDEPGDTAGGGGGVLVLAHDGASQGDDVGMIALDVLGGLKGSQGTGVVALVRQGCGAGIEGAAYGEEDLVVVDFFDGLTVGTGQGAGAGGLGLEGVGDGLGGVGVEGLGGRDSPFLEEIDGLIVAQGEGLVAGDHVEFKAQDGKAAFEGVALVVEPGMFDELSRADLVGSHKRVQTYDTPEEVNGFGFADDGLGGQEEQVGAVEHLVVVTRAGFEAFLLLEEAESFEHEGVFGPGDGFGLFGVAVKGAGVEGALFEAAFGAYGKFADLLEGFKAEGFAVGRFDVCFGEGDGQGGSQAQHGEGGLLGGVDLVVVVEMASEDGVAYFLAFGQERVIFDGTVGGLLGGVGLGRQAEGQGQGAQEQGVGAGGVSWHDSSFRVCPTGWGHGSWRYYRLERAWQKGCI